MNLNYMHYNTPSIKNSKKKTVKKAIKKDKINVSDIARKVLGLKTKIQPKDMPVDVRRNFWCITKMFGSIVKSYTSRHRYKTDGGCGMKLVQDYILQQRSKMDKEIIETYDITDIVWKHPKNMHVIVNECQVHLTEDDNKWGWDAMYDNIKTKLETQFGGEIEEFVFWGVTKLFDDDEADE